MGRNRVEWLALAMSVLAIAIVVAVLVIRAVSQETPASPRVTIHVDKGRQGALGWIVPATVSNDGDGAVQGVGLEASATVAGEPATSEVTVPELAGLSALEVEFAFPARPDGPISVRLVGQEIP